MNSKYLTFKSIEKFKGLLIIFVVAGHVQGLTSLSVQSTIYSFHVTSFFLLPFLFNQDRLSVQNISKVFRRYFVPYTIFFIVTLLLRYFFVKSQITIIDVLSCWLTGTFFLLRQIIGIGAYWFFPALISLLLVVMVFNSLSSSRSKSIFILLMFFGHIGIGSLAGQNGVLQKLPLSFYVPIYLFFVGYVLKRLMYGIEFNKLSRVVIIFVFVLFCMFSTARGFIFNIASPEFPDIFTEPFEFIIRDVLMITGFLAILFISQIIPCTSDFGRLSIAVYTLHPLILQGINLLIPERELIGALERLGVVILLSYLVSFLFANTKVYRFIYPK